MTSIRGREGRRSTGRATGTGESGETTPIHARRAGGWTLIELTIVIALISVLASLAMAGYRTAVTRSREAVLKEDLFRMRDAIDQFYADREAYPATLDDLVVHGYVRAIPFDPFTSSSATWRTVPAPLDSADLLATGIYDVRSGSDRTALDGSQYAEW